jgi:hypothetical protein
MQLELLIGVQLMMPLPPFESTLRYLFEFTHTIFVAGISGSG